MCRRSCFGSWKKTQLHTYCPRIYLKNLRNWLSHLLCCQWSHYWCKNFDWTWQSRSTKSQIYLSWTNYCQSFNSNNIRLGFEFRIGWSFFQEETYVKTLWCCFVDCWCWWKRTLHLPNWSLRNDDWVQSKGNWSCWIRYSINPKW